MKKLGARSLPPHEDLCTCGNKHLTEREYSPCPLRSMITFLRPRRSVGSQRIPLSSNTALRPERDAEAAAFLDPVR